MNQSLFAESKDLENFDKLWNYSKPKQTQLKFEALLNDNLLINYPNYYLELLTQIARTQGLQMNFNSAHNTLDKVKRKMRNSHRVTVRYLLERGRVYNSSGMKKIATPYFEEAYSLAQKLGEESYAVDAAHMLAISLPLKQQVYWNLRALEIIETSTLKDTLKWKGSILNNLGWTYHDLKKYPLALKQFNLVIEEYQKSGNLNRLYVAQWAKARTLRSLKKYKTALNLQLKLLEESKKNQSPDGYVFEELAELYLAMGQQSKSKFHFRKAFELLSKDNWFKKNQLERLNRLKRLGGL